MRVFNAKIYELFFVEFELSSKPSNPMRSFGQFLNYRQLLDKYGSANVKSVQFSEDMFTGCQG